MGTGSVRLGSGPSGEAASSSERERATERSPFTFVTWENVFVAVWRRAATEESVRLLAERGQGLPGKRCAVHIIESGAGLPTAGTRAALGRLMQDRESRLACLAIVLCGEGFWASAVRGVLTGVQLLAPKLPMRFFSDPEAVAQWLPERNRELTGIILDPHALLAVLTKARATD
jgi:hypothetical protein